MVMLWDVPAAVGVGTPDIIVAFDQVVSVIILPALLISYELIVLV